MLLKFEEFVDNKKQAKNITYKCVYLKIIDKGTELKHVCERYQITQ